MKRTWITAAALGIGSMATLWAPAAGALPPGPQEVAPAFQPVISISDASVAEGDIGSKLLHFSVKLNKSSAKKITANVQTVAAVSNPATANVDYSSKFAILEFAPGVTARNFSVTIKGDKGFEADEKFGASIGAVSNATKGKSNGMGTIVNDDFLVIQPPQGDAQPEPPAEDPKPEDPKPEEPADSNDADDTPAPNGNGGSNSGGNGGNGTNGASGGGTSTTVAPTGEQALGTDGTAAVVSEDGDSLMTWLVIITAGLAGAVALILLWPPRRRRSA